MAGCARPLISRSAPYSIAEVSWLGGGALLRMAQVWLPPRSNLSVKPSVCQEVLLYVTAGTVRLTRGAGAYQDLRAGAAYRLGPGPMGEVRNRSRRHSARVVMVLVRDPHAPLDDSFGMPSSPALSACGHAAPPAAGVLPEAPRSLGAFDQPGGQLDATVLLGDRAESGEITPRASLVELAGTASARWSERAHDGSIVAIWFVDGSGTARVGGRAVAVQPGTFLYLSSGQGLHFEPDGRTRLRALVVYSPARGAERWRHGQGASLGPRVRTPS